MQPRKYYANSCFISTISKVCYCGTYNNRHNDLYTKEVFQYTYIVVNLVLTQLDTEQVLE